MVGTVIIEFASVVIVPPKAKALQVQNVPAPTIIASLKAVHTKVLFTPSDKAHPGIHQISPGDAPLDNVIFAFTAVVIAPLSLKTYAPPPFNVIPAAQIEAAPVIQ
jgi:hypothetical protein